MMVLANPFRDKLSLTTSLSKDLQNLCISCWAWILDHRKRKVKTKSYHHGNKHKNAKP